MANTRVNLENNTSAANVAIFLVSTDATRPWFLGFNEVCQNDANLIESYLAGMGYATTITNYYKLRTSSSACDINPSTGQRYAIGNLSYTLGVSPTSYSFTYVHQDPVESYYVRGSTCVTGNSYLGTAVSCAVHLAAKGCSGTCYPQLQAEESRAVASFLYPGSRKVILGDFNLRPRPQSVYHGNPIPEGYYNNYNEGEQGYNIPTRDGSPGVKNDFIFGAKNAFAYRVGYADIMSTTTSDHHYYEASLFS